MFQPTEKLILENIRNKNNWYHQKIDWLLVADMVPGIFLRIKNTQKDFEISKNTLKEIKQSYLRDVIKNELYKQEIRFLAKEFYKSKINLIFLKGASLFTTVYKGDRDLRKMEDIDILIRKKDLEKAEQFLKKVGYEAKETKNKRKIFLEEHFHFTYLKKNIILELHWDIGEKWHWDLVDPKKQYLEMLFNLSKGINIDDTKIKVLSPAHSIFLACFHFERDLFLQFYKIIYTPRIYFSKYSANERLLVKQSLRFFYEIKKMIEYYKDKLAWNELFEIAKATNKEYEVYTLLLIAQKTANVGIPEKQLAKMKENKFVYLYSLLIKRISYDRLDHLFVINRAIYRLMLISSYVYNRKFYLLGMRFLGKRI